MISWKGSTISPFTMWSKNNLSCSLEGESPGSGIHTPASWTWKHPTKKMSRCSPYSMRTVLNRKIAKCVGDSLSKFWWTSKGNCSRQLSNLASTSLLSLLVEIFKRPSQLSKIEWQQMNKKWTGRFSPSSWLKPYPLKDNFRVGQPSLLVWATCCLPKSTDLWDSLTKT